MNVGDQSLKQEQEDASALPLSLDELVDKIKSKDFDSLANSREFPISLFHIINGLDLNSAKNLEKERIKLLLEAFQSSGIQDVLEIDGQVFDKLTKMFKGEDSALKKALYFFLTKRAHNVYEILPFDKVPIWFFEPYIEWLIFAPEAFLEIGEADAYRRHIGAVLADFWQRISKEPRSPLSLKLSQIAATRLNLIPLLFNREGNREIYDFRAKIIAHFLESRGMKLDAPASKAPSNRRRFKVGFLNAHFSSQTETYTSIPAFSHLQRNRFEVVVYSLGSGGGVLENYCRGCVDAFIVLPQALDAQVKKIREDALDAIVIGTNVTAVTNHIALIASFRLAPVQLVNNSSPVTTGMVHVDGYLSGSFLVDESTAGQYSERVLQFDGPAHCFNYEVDRRVPVVSLRRGDLGIPNEAMVFFSGANCFKIIPEMQEAWAQVLSRVPNSYLLLHPFNPNWSNKYPVLRFERSMRAALERHGVDPKRLLISRERLPSRSDVLELIKLADVYLDSFPFAGVNSAVDPLEVGVPLVACELETFRSKMAGSLLRELKIKELIATDEAGYIDLAVKLGTDTEYRKSISSRIVEAMGKNPSFLNPEAYSANMGRIIESLVRRAAPESATNVINSTIMNAQSAYNEGLLSDAEDICRELLAKDEKCAGAWALLGRMALLNGDLETAGDFASVACELEPVNTGFIRDLGEVFLRRKEFEAAEGQARRALELQPESSESLVFLGRVLAEKGEQGNALGAFEKALRLKKDDAEPITHYAMALQKFDRGKDAISQIRKACALEPDSVEHQTNFASLLEQNKRFVDALAAYGKAARMNPDVGYIWFRQGKLLNGLKRYAEAIPVLEKAISLPGVLGEYFYELGLALHMTKRFQEALEQYNKALANGYNTAALQCNRGVIFKEIRKGGDAIMAFHAAVKMDPSNVSYLNNLGAAALELGLNSEALGCFEEAVRQNPKLPTAQNNIGNLLKDRARGMDALPHYRKAMELDPENHDTQSNYLLCHMYLSEMDSKEIFEEHRKWGLTKTKKTPPAFKFKPRQPGAKLRVAFLSPDLCHHPVAHFIEPLFREYDRTQIEFIAYADQRKSDEFSERFSKQVDLWRETCSLNDQALAKQIYEDRVDILFELSGHTAYNRLPVLALKPAPLQASYLGYPGTTGLPTIGFRITDALVDPVGMTEKFHTERLVRMSRCAWCYEPDAVTPDIVPVPALEKGHITFGCFNNMAKLNPALFAMWAEILLQVPESHLRLKAKTLTDEGVKKELKEYFTSRGIAEERLDFFGHTRKIHEHLSHYNEVDIALDSYPYHGTTTTCEALWMGCPVITRSGTNHVSRVGVSLMTAVGLQEFVCDSAESYIAKAVELSSDMERLSGLRSGMRERLESSPLMDSKGFARDFESALKEIAAVR